MKREVRIWTVRLSILLILVTGFFFIKNALDDFNAYPTGTPLKEDSLKFNSAEWKEASVYREAVRPYMVKDLMTNVLRTGMDSTTVKDLLGEPWGPHNSKLWEYRLGVYREVEASYLQIEFDDNGKLKRAEITDR